MSYSKVTHWSPKERNMPSSTFLNLPNEKREKLMNKFYDEFSKNSYREASISKIVADLKIAKGSIYKYFENKQDLYFYLIECAAQTKLKELGSKLSENSYDDMLWAIIETGSEFDINHPVLTRFLNRVLTDSHEEFDRDIKGEIGDKSYTYILGVVQQGIENGSIRTDVNKETISHYINTVLTHTGLILAAKHGQNLDDYLDNARSECAADSTQNSLKKELKEIYELLVSGIKKQ